MAHVLDNELKKLVIGTNDQRRRFGQTLFHFYKTLIFWRDKGLSFHEVTRAWSAGGAAIFDSLAATLEEMGPQEVDAHLRRYCASFLEHLADDLERGDHMVIPFLRWLETCFPELTEMMQRERGDSRILDQELAAALGRLLAYGAQADRADFVAALRQVAGDLQAGVESDA